MGVASIKWVRPIFTTLQNSSALRSSASCSRSSAGIRPLRSDSPTATWRAVGMTSLLDCPMLTWSLGCTGSLEPMGLPASWQHRLAITSLAFMLVLVPEPVWKTSTGKCASRLPLIISSATREMSVTRSSSSMPSSRFASAAAHLIKPNARMNSRLNRYPEIGKFNTARCVEAP